MSQGKSLRGKIVGPGSTPNSMIYQVGGMTYEGPIVGDAQAGDTVPVLFGKSNWRKPLALGQRQARPSYPLAFFQIAGYPPGLPLAGLSWLTHNRDDGRSKYSGWSDGAWKPRVGAAPACIAYNPVLGPVRQHGNRLFMVVGGEELDESVGEKIVATIPPNRYGEAPVTSQPNPYRLRIIHQNIAQGSPDGASDQPGNGVAEDFGHNLRIYDLELSDATGISWTAESAPKAVVPVDMMLSPYQQRDIVIEPGETTDPTGLVDRMTDERVWVVIIWAAPAEQGSPTGRKWSFNRESHNVAYLEEAEESRFLVSRHLVNFRRSYVERQSGNPVSLFACPLVAHSELATPGEGGTTDGLTEIWAVHAPVPGSPGTFAYQFLDQAGNGWLRNYLTVRDLPEQFTQWVSELSFAPMAITHRGEAPYGEEPWDDTILVVGCKTANEVAAEDEHNRIAELHVARVRSSDGTVLGTTELEIPAVTVPWDLLDENNFFADRPAEDVGAIPWHDSTFRFGDDYRSAFGLIRYGGYLENFIFHHTSNAIYIIPKWSDASQIICWEVTHAGSVSQQWNIVGDENWPPTYRSFTVCGLYNVAEAEEEPNWQLLIHFEERGVQSVSAIWAPHADWTGMEAYENGQGVTIPEPGTDGYFTIYDWPRASWDHAFDWGDWDDVDWGGPIDELTLTEIFDHLVSYWLGREDEDGWSQISSDYCLSTVKNGYFLVAPASGVKGSDAYVEHTEGTAQLRTGDLQADWASSVMVERYEDPRDIEDASGPVFSDAPDEEGRNGWGMFEPLGPGQAVKHLKVWSVRYEYNETESAYENPTFGYLRAAPGFIGSDTTWHSLAFLNDRDGGPPEGFPSGAHGNFDLIDWGRVFYGVRYYTDLVDVDIETSKQMAISPTRGAFLGRLAVFLMQQRRIKQVL